MRLVSVIQGTEEVGKDLEGISDRLDADEEAMTDIGLIGLRRSQLSFESQGWDGVHWPDLTKKTIARRRNKNKGSIQILRDTGALMQSLAQKAEFSLWLVNVHQVQWGSNRPGADAHQDGYPERNIPKRQFAGWTDQDLIDYQETYLDWALGFGKE